MKSIIMLKKTLYSSKTTLVLLLLILLISVFADSEEQNPSDIADYSYASFYDKATNTMNISKMPLRLKIAQMIVVNYDYGLEDYYKDINYGGIYLVKENSKEDFLRVTDFFSCAKEECIPTFISVDLEGRYSNPFSNFQEFECFSDISSANDAYALGDNQGKLLQQLGINMIFSPVVDIEDNIWRCRNFEKFKDDPYQLSNVAKSYLQGLKQHDVLAVAKHYPGKTLNNIDPHKNLIYQTIEENDIIPFKNNYDIADGIMITHTISDGAINSYNKPCSISKPVINEIKRGYSGLIISDEISMMALTDYYNVNDISNDQMYIDLFNAGNDVIIYFDLDTRRMNNLLDVVTEAVNSKKIDEKQIDRSVAKILSYKKIKVVE